MEQDTSYNPIFYGDSDGNIFIMETLGWSRRLQITIIKVPSYSPSKDRAGYKMCSTSIIES